jgi:hypothetical protein
VQLPNMAGVHMKKVARDLVNQILPTAAAVAA